VSAALPSGLPTPAPARDGLERPYWEGTRARELRVQRCTDCGTWRFGPEWICYACRSFATTWITVEPLGLVYSWERVWHPVHRALDAATPYVVVLVELPHAGGIRMVGNLVGGGEPRIGARVRAVFEDHPGDESRGTAAYTLVQWTLEEESK
jgi:uncharacterized OB-fold protein